MRFIELNYYYHGEFTTPAEVILKHRPSNLFAAQMAEKADITLIKHLDYTGSHQESGVNYRFFKSKNSFIHIPFATHRFIKNEKPDMVLVQGFIFPLQVISLGIKLGKDSKIVLQHQGEVPFQKKRIFQKWADRYVDGYIFTSFGNATEWIEAGVIKDTTKCFEVIPSSTGFSRQDKELSKQKLGIEAPINFLWVGRLNANKDPLTILKAFERYFTEHPQAKLFMIYSEDDLLPEIKHMIATSHLLENRVDLIGKVPHDELQDWYSAADYFVSGSHREGGSFALTEAMACGCIPIVTDIPAAMKVTGDGKAGYYYSAGNNDELYHVLTALNHKSLQEMSTIVESHFQQYCSPRSIAEKMMAIYDRLKSK
jgi:glycosyltransferase involved in cell wall biosynthesis